MRGKIILSVEENYNYKLITYSSFLADKMKIILTFKKNVFNKQSFCKKFARTLEEAIWIN